MIRVLLSILMLALTSTACKREESFKDIGYNIASPVDVAMSADGNIFYVLNSDFDRSYNEGSILAIDANDDTGVKLGAVNVPRMGRSITVSGTDMLVTIDFQDDESGPRAMLFDLADDPKTPRFVKEWALECSPFNATMRKDPSTGKTYGYFAITCIDGPLYVGRLTDDRAASTLKMVRNYGITRRALYLDTQRDLLLAFTTDPAAQKTADFIEEDKLTYDVNVVATPGPNEIPDVREASKAAQTGRGSRQLYQFVVYDIAAEAQVQPGCEPTEGDDCTFPLRRNTDAYVEKELRWIYFKLYNFDGTPDPNSGHGDPGLKYYRTNFYEAQPDPQDPDAFYLSHRGPPKDSGSPHANQIIKVSFVGDVRVSAEGFVPNTGDVLAFDRVYGFKGGESTPFHYPGDFEVGEVQGQKLLVVNHFRDLVNWVREDVYFSVAAKTLDDNSWFSELIGDKGSASSIKAYFQIAMNANGRALSCNYYGGAVELLQITPSFGINPVVSIK